MSNNYFIESSALAKRYKREEGSDWICQLFDDDQNSLFYLNLTILEVQKLIYRLRYHPQSAGIEMEAQINDQTMKALLARSSSDFLKMKVVQLTQAMVHRSAGLLQNHWVPSSIDILQAAAFLEVRETYPKTKFVSADTKLNELVNSLMPGAVINPSMPSPEVSVQTIRGRISGKTTALF